MAEPTGKVYLVGSGPGDPGLLTLRGRELLARADVVLYDYLANPLLMKHAQADAELICLGRHGRTQGRGRIVDQEDIHRQMVAAAQNGKQVVRLKGGDPGVFGRMGEELTALEAAGVAYEIVPGVTAALAASSYSGVPLTHRDHASCVALITGQESRMKSGSKLDVAGLARFPGTLVFYMGVTTAPDWSSELIAHGKPGDTPVAIIRHASLPTQRVLTSTLGELVSVLAPGKIRPPAIIVVGEAVAARSTLQWFSSRPLFGRQVLIARPEHQAAELTAQLSELGASVLLQPGICISEPKDWQPVDEAISRFSEYDWLVFSSVNGVNYFLRRLLKSGSDLRSLSGIKLASVGPGTTEALAAFHLKADLQPDEYRAEALAEALSGEAEGNRFLLLRASRGREVLAELLRSAGAEVEQVIVYQSSDVTEPAEEVGTAMATGKVDWALVTSSAIARSLIAMFGEQLCQTRLAAISPITADVLSEAGYSPAVVAEQHTTESLLAAILAAETAG